MSRFTFLAALFLAMASVDAFTAAPRLVSRPVTSLLASDDDMSGPNKVERGVSVDQDGKSNVWAIEPKMEVSTKSSEESTQSALIAGGGLAAAAVAAGLILSNLPDPSQF